MTNMFRFRSNDPQKGITLIPETESQQDQLVEMLRKLNGTMPSPEDLMDFACMHGIAVRQEIETTAYCFRTLNPSESVVFYPDTDTQREKTLYMLDMWEKNNLGNCGTIFAEDYAKQHGIPYKVTGRI